MSSLGLAALAALGTYLIVTHRRPVGPQRSFRVAVGRVGARARQMLDHSGLDDVTVGQFVAASLGVGAAALLPAIAIFGFGAPAVVIAVAASFAPAIAWRRRREAARRAAREAWPRMIEELRVQTGSAGRSIPQALLEVGLRGPAELQPAFRAAQREWALTTDFERTVRVLTARLDDPTADAACETLLIASEVGGDLDRRLAALAEDRRQDLQGRKEAEAKQAGARLARSFVILVPAGMAFAGLSVGDGRAAYGTAQGQALVVAGIAMVLICWIWAGRVMRLPEPDRVFDT